MIDTTPHAGLASALRTAMTGHANAGKAWRAVHRVVDQEIRARRATQDIDDVRQEVSIRLLLAQNTFNSDHDNVATAFIRKVTRNVVIDRKRHAQRRPQALPFRDGDRNPVDTLPAPDPASDVTADLEAASELLIDRMLGEVDLLIEQSGVNATRRELMRLQAHARVLSCVRDKGSQEIAHALGAPDVSNACIQKWVERGLPILLQALERLAKTAEPDERRVLENVTQAIAKRRTDAGKTRETRRKTQRVEP